MINHKQQNNNNYRKSKEMINKPPTAAVQISMKHQLLRKN